MLWRIFSISAKILEKFPDVLTWSSLSHFVQLSLKDTVGTVNKINLLKIILS